MTQPEKRSKNNSSTSNLKLRTREDGGYDVLLKPNYFNIGIVSPQQGGILKLKRNEEKLLINWDGFAVNYELLFCKQLEYKWILINFVDRKMKSRIIYKTSRENYKKMGFVKVFAKLNGEIQYIIKRENLGVVYKDKKNGDSQMEFSI